MSKEKSVRKLVRFDLVTAPEIEYISKRLGKPFTSVATEIMRDGLALEKWQRILKK